MSENGPVHCGKERFPAEFEAELERRKLESLAEFAAGAGHEINNPLAIISGHAQMMMEQVDNPQHRRSLSVIIAQVKRAYEMIADIRLFARPPELEIRRFDLVELLEELLKKQRKDYEDRSLEIRWNTAEKDLLMESDPVQVSVLVLALIRNAVESQEDHGTISLALSVNDSGEEAVLCIEDGGCGIPEEIRPLIFSPFFSGRNAGRGLGFGLSKAWSILRQCGGSIEVDSPLENGKGARFTVRIPGRLNSRLKPE